MLYLLEDRVYFDGAAAATATETQADTNKNTTTSDSGASSASTNSADSSSSASHSESSTSATSATDVSALISAILHNDASLASSATGKEVLVVSSQASNYSDLVAAAETQHFTVVTYDPAAESLSQIVADIQTSLHGSKAESINFVVADDATDGFTLVSDNSTTSDSISSQSSFWSSVSSLLTDHGAVSISGDASLASAGFAALETAIASATGHEVSFIDATDGSVSTTYADSQDVNVYFIDSSVKDASSLVSQLPDNSTVVYLTSGGDGVQEITDYLASHRNIDSVNILTHGNVGRITLGADQLDSTTLASTYSAQVASWGQSLTSDGDINIYSCFTATDAKGEAFVHGIASLTGADVAAATDVVGSTGNWTLDYTVGAVANTGLSIYGYNHSLDNAANWKEFVDAAENGAVTEIVLLNSFQADTSVGGAKYLTADINHNITITGAGKIISNNSDVAKQVDTYITIRMGVGSTGTPVATTVTMKNLTLDGSNKSAIDIKAGNTLDATDATFSNNGANDTFEFNSETLQYEYQGAENGGAIYAEDATTNYKSAVKIHSCSFDGNMALNGGAIYLGQDNDLTIAITDKGTVRPTFTNNSGAISGGAIFMGVDSNTSAPITSTDFTGNSAGKTFALLEASYVDSQGHTIVIPASNVTYIGTGGALYLADGNYVVNPPATHRASATIVGCIFEGNSSNGNAGAIYVGQFGNFTVSVGSTTPGVKSYFLGNDADGNGGVIYASTSTNLVLTYACFGYKEVSGSYTYDYTKLEVVVPLPPPPTTKIIDQTGTVRSSTLTTYRANTAGGDGGAIYMAPATSDGEGGKLTLTGVVFGADFDPTEFKNIVTDKTPATNPIQIIGEPGTLYLADQPFSYVYDVKTISAYNSAGGNGGAIYLGEYSSLTDAHYITGSPASVTQQSGFYYNHADGNGGAIFAEAATTITLSGNRSTTSQQRSVISLPFTGNSSGASGGAIYLSSPEIGHEGGAGARVTADMVDFISNSAEVDGGAVFLESKASFIDRGFQYEDTGDNLSPIHVYNYVYNNTALNGKGGAIYVSTGANVTLENVLFSDDRALNTLAGGAIYLETSGAVTATESHFYYVNSYDGNDDRGCSIMGDITKSSFVSSTLYLVVDTNSGGVGSDVDGDHSLSWCVNYANNYLPFNYTINFYGDYTITLQNIQHITTTAYTGIEAGYFICTPVTTTPNDISRTGGYYIRDITIDASTSKTAFQLDTGSHFTISGGGVAYMTLTGATTSAVIVTADARLYLGFCTFDGNNAVNGSGAAVYVQDGGYLYTGQVIHGCTLYHIYQDKNDLYDKLSITTVFQNNFASVSGGAIYVADCSSAQSSAHVSMVFTYFKNNSSTKDGGALYLGSGVNAYFLEQYFYTNDIYDRTYLWELGPSVFNGNYSVSGNGGAIYVSSNVAFTLDCVILKYNHALNGGAVYVAPQASAAGRSSISVNGVTFTGNYASGDSTAPNGNGGAIYLGSYDSMTMSILTKTNDYGEVFYFNVSFDGNYAESAYYSTTAITPHGTGGAIFLGLDSSYTATGMDVSSTVSSFITFTGNYARNTSGFDVLACVVGSTAAGGALYVANDNSPTGTHASLTLTTVKFIGNGTDGLATYTYYGGAIFTGDYSTLRIVSTGYFENNAAVTYGGAIYAGANSTLAITSVNGGTVYPFNSSFLGNTAGVAGGALYLGAGAGLSATGKFYAPDAFNVNSDGVLFQNNRVTDAGSIGGAIYLSANAGATLNDCTFKMNTAVASGGAIGTGITSTISLIGSTFIKNGSAYTVDYSNGTVITANGGAIYLDSSSSLSATYLATGNAYLPYIYTTFSSNKVLEASGLGGAIYASGGATLNFTSVIFNRYYSTDTQSCAYQGGALYLGTNVILTGTDCTFSSLTANLNGGAICIANGTGSYLAVSLTTSSFIYNKSLGGSGGAIYAGSYAGVSLTNSNLNHNTAALNGGGIWLSGTGTLTATLTTITYNTAANGAGIYAADREAASTTPDITLSGATITYNSASTNGAGVFAGEYVNLSVTTADSTDASGAAIVVKTLFKQNGANYTTSVVETDNGAAIYLSQNTTLTADNVNFIFNYVSIDGGAIFMAAAANATISLSTFTSNSSANGGAVYVVAGATLNVKSSTFSNNTASALGGAIYNAGSLTLESSTLNANSSTSNGGAVYNSAGTLTITNCTFYKNYATAGSGGAIYNSAGSTLTVNSSTFADNYVSNGYFGGALYTATGSNVVLKNSIFADNYSDLLGVHTMDDIYNDDALTPIVSGMFNIYGATFNYTIDPTDLAYVNGASNLWADEFGNALTAAKLANNGGPTLTLNIVEGGLAYQAIAISGFNGVPSIDQRGYYASLTVRDIGSVQAGSGIGPSTEGDYMTKDDIASGNWSDAVNWLYYNGTAWVDAVSTVGLAVAAHVLVTGTSNISLDTNASVSGLLVIGGTVSIGSFNFTIASCMGDGTLIGGLTSDLTITANSTVTLNCSLTIRNFSIGSNSSFTLSSQALNPHTLSLAPSGSITGVAANVSNITATIISVDSGSASIANVKISSQSSITVALDATLAITGCTISGNSSAGNGGAIVNNGTLTITNCTLSGNSSAGNGGAIYNSATGSLTIVTSTFHGNYTTAGSGGAVYNDAGTLSINSSTFADNYVTNSVATPQYGGAVYTTTGFHVTLKNSIFADNYSDLLGVHSVDDIYNADPLLLIVSGGYNIVGASANYTAATSDISYTSGFDVLWSTGLGGSAVLADNGGSTFTINISADGIAYQVVKVPGFNGVPLTDQRGYYASLTARDIGAIQTVGTGPTHGGDYRTKDNVTGNWSDAANWEVFDAGTSAWVNATDTAGLSTANHVTVTATANITINIGTASVSGLLILSGTVSIGSNNFTVANATGSGTLIGGDTSSLTVSGNGMASFVCNITLLSLNVGSGSIFNLSYSTLTLADSGTITGAGASLSSIIFTPIIVVSGSSSISNITIGNSNTSAVVVSSGATLLVSGAAFSGNASTGNGGAILNNGSLTVNGSSFSSNSATLGGAIYSDGTLTVENSSFSSNTATIGGAIYLPAVDPLAAQSVSILGSTFTGNSATAGDGGAIYAGSNVGLVIAEYVDLLSVTHTNAFNGNTAVAGNGGAIYAGSALSVAAADFSSNSALSGGAIYLPDAAVAQTISILGSTFTGNSATDAIVGNGGAIRVGTNTTLTIGDYTTASAHTYYSQFTGNSAFDGGAIYLASNVADSSSAISILADSAVTFSSNTATDKGGAIYLADNDSLSSVYNATITAITFNGNKAGIAGGAIYANAASLDINSANFTSNAEITGGLSTFEGGAIYAVASVLFNVAASSFSLNSADNGGAIYLADAAAASPATIYGASFTSNTATLGNGGAIYAGNNINLTVGYYLENTNNSSFTSNSALSGGAVYLATGSSLTLSDTAFETNSAATAGGAIFAAATAVLNISNATFTSNTEIAGGTAVFNGGAIYLTTGASLTLVGSAFTTNSADNGGAVYAETGTALSVSDSTFTSNTALGTPADDGHGGAIYLADSTQLAGATTLAIFGSTFTSNGSLGAGGAIYVGSFNSITLNSYVNGATTLNNLFDGNTAATSGGAILLAASSSLSVALNANASFAGNKALNGAGGAIAAEDLVAITTSRATGTTAAMTFESNMAKLGGAIALAASATATISSSYFKDNIASTNGGALYVADSGLGELAGTLTIIYSDFEANIATGNGGAIYFSAANASITASTFYGNQAALGGALYVAADSVVDIVNATFAENQVDIYAAAGATTVANSIFADIATGSTYNIDGATGLVVSNGYNIVEYSTDAYTAGTADYTGKQMLLWLNGTAALSYGDHGGATKTIAISAPGNAYHTIDMNSVNWGLVGSYDQRGVAPSDTTNRDRGAFQSTSIIDNPHNGDYITLKTGNWTDVNAANIWGKFSDAQGWYSLLNTTDTPDGNANVTITYDVHLSSATQIHVNNLYLTATLYMDGVTLTGFNGSGTVYTGSTIGFGHIVATGVNGLLNLTVTGLSSTSATSSAIIVNAGGAFTLQSVSFTTNAGNVDVAAGASLVVRNCSFTNNSGSAFNGGAIYAEDGTSSALADHATITVYGSTFTGNSADNGGAIYIGSYGTLSLATTANSFTGNSAVNSGGAIYIGVNATLTVAISSTFTSNTATNGGAIYAASNLAAGSVSVQIANCTFTSNSAVNGGAIYAGDYRNLSLASSVSFTTNTATANGGAVYLGSNTTLTSAARFTGNKATASSSGNVAGGAIFASSNASLTIAAGSSFSGNEASSVGGEAAGGAIYVSENGVLTIGSASSSTLTTFALNTAEQGGAIYAGLSVTIVANSTLFTSNRATSSDDAAGGAVFADDFTTLSFLGAGSSFKLNTASSDTASASGGAIFAGNDVSLTIRTTSFNGNTAAGGVSAEGGAISFGSNGTLSIVGTAKAPITFVSNKATVSEASGVAAGGAISSSSSFQINYATFANNAASKGGAIAIADGIDSDYATIALLNCSFYTNSAIAGGAFSLGDYAHLTATSCMFSGNFAKGTGVDALGGALYAGNYSVSSITASSFVSNSAVSDTANAYGGAIGTDLNATVTIANTRFSTNLASASAGTGVGGAIYMGQSSSLVISGTSALPVTFSGNSVDASTGLGGAIFTSSSASITYATFDSANTASYGGAIATNTNGTSLVYASIVLSNCTFSGNSATVSGGAVYIGDYAHLTATSTSFSNNTSRSAAGAIYAGGYAVINISLSSFTGNTVTSYAGSSYGGAIRTENNVTLEIASSSFTNNAAKVTGSDIDSVSMGGAIYMGSDGSLTITGTSSARTTFSGNFATGNNGIDCGGAIFSASDTTINYATFSKNYALTSETTTSHPGSQTAYGGAICFYGHVTSVSNSIFTGNYTTSGAHSSAGGAILIYASRDPLVNTATASFTSCTFTSNTSDDGGAISLYYSTTATFTSCTFTSNSSVSYGGAIHIYMRSALETFTTTLNIVGSTFSKNFTTGIGGAIYAGDYSVVNISAGTFSGNYSTNGGGAIYMSGSASANVIQSTFASNHASNGGAIYNAAASVYVFGSTFNANYSSSSSGAAARGGAIYNAAGSTLTLLSSTFYKNTTELYGGALYNDGSTTVSTVATVSNCTFANNSVVTRLLSRPTATPSGNGGAIYGAEDSTLFLSNSILADNSSGYTYSYRYTYQVVAPATYIEDGRTISNLYVPTVTYITKTETRTATVTSSSDIAGVATSRGYNIVETYASGFSRQTTDILGSQSNLFTGKNGAAVLANNGGPTYTIAISTASKAYKAIAMVTGSTYYNGSLSIDQRGFYAPSGSRDIGAYQTRATAPTGGDFITAYKASGSFESASSWLIFDSASKAWVVATDASMTQMGAASRVTIDNGSSLTTNATLVVNTLTVAAGASLTANADLTVNNLILIGGPASFATGAGITIVVITLDLEQTGDFTLPDTIDASQIQNLIINCGSSTISIFSSLTLAHLTIYDSPDFSTFVTADTFELVGSGSYTMPYTIIASNMIVNRGTCVIALNSVLALDSLTIYGNASFSGVVDGLLAANAIYLEGGSGNYALTDIFDTSVLTLLSINRGSGSITLSSALALDSLIITGAPVLKGSAGQIAATSVSLLGSGAYKLSTVVDYSLIENLIVSRGTATITLAGNLNLVSLTTNGTPTFSTKFAFTTQSLSVESGSFKVPVSFGSSLTGTLNVAAGATATLQSNFAISGAQATVNGTLATAKALDLNSAVIAGTGILNVSGVNGSLTAASSSFLGGTLSITGSKAFTIPAGLTINNLLVNRGSAAITLGSALNLQSLTVYGAATFVGNITAHSLTVASGSFAMPTTMTSLDSLTIAKGATLTLKANLAIGAALANSGTLNAGSYGLTLSGLTSIGTGKITSSFLTLDNCTLTQTSGLTFVSNTLTLTNSSLTLSANLAVKTLSIDATSTLTLSGKSLSVSGSLGNFGTIVGDSTAAIAFTGAYSSYLGNLSTLGTLTLNNAGATVMLDADLRLAKSIVLTKGKLDIAGHALSYAASSGGSSSSYIYSSVASGTVTKDAAAKGYTYAVGTASSYTPAKTTLANQHATWNGTQWNLSDVAMLGFCLVPSVAMRKPSRKAAAEERSAGLSGDFSSMAALEGNFKKHPSFKSGVDSLLDAFVA